MKLLLTETLVPLLNDVEFVMMATSFERNCLITSHAHLEWQTIGHVPYVHMGDDHGRPIGAQLHWYSVSGHKVMFVQPRGPIYNDEIIEGWLEANCAPTWGNSDQPARANPEDFLQCLQILGILPSPSS